jgi:hypothetical protein
MKTSTSILGASVLVVGAGYACYLFRKNHRFVPSRVESLAARVEEALSADWEDEKPDVLYEEESTTVIGDWDPPVRKRFRRVPCVVKLVRAAKMKFGTLSRTPAD